MRPVRVAIVCLAVAQFVCLRAPLSVAAETATESYDHLKDSNHGPVFRTVKISPGQFIQIEVLNLDKTFTLSWEPLMKEGSPSAEKVEDNVPPEFRARDLGAGVAHIDELLKRAAVFPFRAKDSSQTKAVIPHTPGNAGYVVRIEGEQRWVYRPEPGQLLGEAEAESCRKWLEAPIPAADRPEWLRIRLATIVELYDTRAVVLVFRVPERLGWQVDVAGALLASTLADEEYAAVRRFSSARGTERTTEAPGWQPSFTPTTVVASGDG
jgi:hypothetical protein